MAPPDSDKRLTPAADGSGGAARTVREERSLDRMRQTIADRLQESYRNAVHVTESREIDAEAMLEATEIADERLDVDVAVPDIVVAAVSATLDEHPAFNATFEDGTHRIFEEHNIGFAVDIEAGLVTPVLADVGAKSLGEVARHRRELVDRVQDGDYSMSDLRGGTFTVTNLGPLGVDSFTPIINPPQVAILGLNRVRERAQPAGDDADGDVAFRRTTTLDLTFDHRVVDGADAARFLGTLAAQLEDATSLIPEDSKP